LKVLIIGGGGREHAIAVALATSMPPSAIHVAPGNAGIARSFPCLALRSHREILDWCLGHRPRFVVFGPEQPLAEGLSDLLASHGIPCVGPSQAAARIETSKVFAKGLMAGHNIPTAEYTAFTDSAPALEYLRQQNSYPVVLKADGLAAGKGVVIVHNLDEAEAALGQLSGLGSSIIVEEFLSGWEASLFVITDGTSFKTTLFAQDYKQAFDGDQGPNTGGMGACCPIPEAEPYRERIEHDIVSPTLEAMKAEGCPYRGFLYCGLMITPEGPKVLEFNCRLGDPETQALLPLLDTPFEDICRTIADGTVGDLILKWKDLHSVCVVLAARGYPGAYEKGDPITIGEESCCLAMYSGVAESGGRLVTNGGRVMSLVALAGSVEEARLQAYRCVEAVDFRSKYYRKDISLRNNKLIEVDCL
jgi:phosphoribosylamine--glycine ligase